MTTMTWADPSARTYESGVEKGVIRSKSGLIIPWNGLISVQETEEEASVTDTYFDGVKIESEKPRGFFTAQIVGVELPSQFDDEHLILGRAIREIQGFVDIRPGFYLTGQNKREFDFSYQTLLPDGDYKIHLVWDARVVVSTTGSLSLGDTVQVETFTWAIRATPPRGADGYLGSAHYVIDSRKIDPTVLSAVEDYLYGTESTFPYFPTQEELLEFFA